MDIVVARVNKILLVGVKTSISGLLTSQPPLVLGCGYN